MEKYTHILSYDERYQRLMFLKRDYTNCLLDDALEGNDTEVWARLLRIVSSILQNMIFMRTGIKEPLVDIWKV